MLSARQPDHRGVGHRRPPPADRDRKVVPHVKTRPASPADLPPPARLDRGPPDHRVRALAISRFIEQTTGWSIRKFVRTARRYRTIEIQAGAHTITALTKLPPLRKRKGSSWTSDQAGMFLESSRDGEDYLYAAYVLVLVLGLGLRKGEVLGLTWDHIDWAT
jgi:integrase